MHLIYKDAFLIKYSAELFGSLPAQVARYKSDRNRAILYDYESTLKQGIIVCPLIEPDSNIRVDAANNLLKSKKGLSLLNLLGLKSKFGMMYSKYTAEDLVKIRNTSDDAVIDIFPLMMFANKQHNVAPSFTYSTKAGEQQYKAYGEVKMAQDNTYLLSSSPAYVHRKTEFGTHLQKYASDYGLRQAGMDRINILNSRVLSWCADKDDKLYSPVASLNLKEIYKQNVDRTGLRRDLQIHCGNSIFDSEGCYISFGVLLLYRKGGKYETVFAISPNSSKRQGTVEPALLRDIGSILLAGGGRGYFLPGITFFCQALIQHNIESRIRAFVSSPYETKMLPSLTIMMAGKFKKSYEVIDNGVSNKIQEYKGV